MMDKIQPDFGDYSLYNFPPVSELEFLPLFVYGTLRLGGSLHHLVEPYIIKTYDNLYFNGKLYSSTQGLWPVAQESQDSTVLGSLLILKPEPAVIISIFKEELLYGYDLTWQNIFNRADNTRFGKALVCTWSSEQFLHTFIPSGDWLAYLESN